MRTVLSSSSVAYGVYVWSRLVYALGDGLFALPFDIDTLTTTSGPVSMVEGVVRAAVSASANYAISDGGTLFHMAGRGSAESPLLWLDRTGVTEAVSNIPPNAFSTPRLSPDGDRVLVVADGDARIYDLASGRERRVTTDGATGPFADWTPSGAEVAYSSSRGSDGEDNVWLQPADGSGVARQVTTLGGEVHVDAWAPDGRTFSAHHHDQRGSIDLLIVRLDGQDAETEVWLEREFTDSNAVFSPDGRYVAFMSTQTGQREIYIQPFPGPGGQTPVSVGGGEEVAWAPNGEVFYRRTGDYAMMAVEVSTDPELVVGPPVQLFSGGAALGGGGTRSRYAVTADGQRFLMSAALLRSGEGEGNSTASQSVNIVLNWHSELLERVPVP